MKRRDLIFSSAALALLPRAAPAAMQDLEDWLYEPVSAEVGPRLPAKTGRLSAEQYAALHSLFGRVGELWGMQAASGINEGHFQDLVEQKTSQEPSYLTEYSAAVDILDALSKASTTRGLPIDRLLLPTSRPDPAIKTRLGRACKYVGSEFVAWYVTQGGFKRYGYRNYRGFIGGPFNMSPPPYRMAVLS